MASKTPTSAPSEAIVDRLWDLYCENPTRFHMARNGRVYMPKDGKVPRPLQRNHVVGHLAGYYALCLFGQEGASRFICFDVDHGGWELVQKAIVALHDIGFERDKIYTSTSGNKGYHIEMFFTAPIEYTLMKRLHREVLRRTEATSRDIELRPSDKRSIKIPLSKHQKTGRHCWYVDTETGKEIPNPRFVFRIQRIEVSLAQNYMKECRAETTRSEITKPRTQIDVAELPSITERGTRHDMILNIIGAIEARGYSENECRRILNAWYVRQDKNLIGTKDEDAFKDISDTIGWAYRKGHRTSITASIFPADVIRITSIRSMVGRAIYFHVLVWERVMNEDQTAQRQLADLFGVSDKAVLKALDGLKQRGYIETVIGKRHRDKHGYYMDKTCITVAGRVTLDPSAAKTATVIPKQMQDDFWKTYFDTLFALADKDWLASKLCKRERERLWAIMEREQAKGQ